MNLYRMSLLWLVLALMLAFISTETYTVGAFVISSIYFVGHIVVREVK